MGILDVFRRGQPQLEAKSGSYTEALIYAVDGGSMYRHDYAGLATQGYKRNPIGYRAVRYVADSAAAVQPLLMQRQRGGDVEVDEHEALDRLRTPNSADTYQTFMASLVGTLLLGGEAFVHGAGPLRGPPKELYLLPPNHVTVKRPARMGDAITYEYRPDGQNVTRYDDREVLHLRMWDPLGGTGGTSPFEAALGAIEQSNLGGDWNIKLLRNSGRPSLVVISKRALSPEQMNQLRAGNDSLYAGGANAGRIAVFQGSDLEVEPFGMTPNDLDWLEGTKAAEARLALAIGVPPELLNLGTTTFNNRSEARKSLYTETVMPLLQVVFDRLSAWYVSRWDRKLYLVPWVEKIDALQPDRDKQYSRLDASFKGGWLKLNEVREEAGYEPDEKWGGLFFWEIDSLTRFGVLPPDPSQEPVSGSSPASPPPDAGSGDGAGDPSIDPAQPVIDPTAPSAQASVRGQRLQTKAFRLGTEEAKASHWRSVEQRRQQWEARATIAFAQAFDRERKLVVEQAKRAQQPGDLLSAHDQAVDPQDLTDTLTRIYLGVMEDFGRSTREAILPQKSTKAIEDVFGVLFPQVLEWVAQWGARQVVRVASTTKDAIARIVRQGIDAGSAIDQIAGMIDSLYLEQIIPNRSRVIARTEVVRASNGGSQMAARGTGLKLQKVWLSSRDDRVRQPPEAEFDHYAADGETVAMDAPYVLTGEPLMFPGDPSGSAGNTIQCRCTEYYEPQQDGTPT